MFIALRNYNFRLFWCAQIISLTGSWMQTVGLSWLVLTLTHRADQLGFITTLQFLPILLFALIGGVVADRVNKRGFLLFTQSFATIQAFLLGLLVHHRAIQMWQLDLLAFLGGLNTAFDNPTRQAFVMEMVGKEDLSNAVALNSGLFNLARIVGPSIGGIIIGNGSLTRIAWTFYANSLSFAPAIISLALMMPALLRTAPRRSGGRVFAEVIEGWRYLFSRSDTTLITVMIAIVGLFGFNFSVSLPLLAAYLKIGARGFGVFSSCMGAGSLMGAVYMARRRYFTKRLLLVGAGLFAVFMTGVALSGSATITGALLLCTGLAGILCNTSGNTLLQTESPDALRGRIMSIFFLLLAGSTPIGGYITGVIAQHWGIRNTLGLEMAIQAAGVTWGVFYYFRRKLRFGDLRARAESEALLAAQLLPATENHK